jgi:hypothetical protein
MLYQRPCDQFHCRYAEFHYADGDYSGCRYAEVSWRRSNDMLNYDSRPIYELNKSGLAPRHLAERHLICRHSDE